MQAVLPADLLPSITPLLKPEGCVVLALVMFQMTLWELLWILQTKKQKCHHLPLPSQVHSLVLIPPIQLDAILFMVSRAFKSCANCVVLKFIVNVKFTLLLQENPSFYSKGAVEIVS